MDDDILSQPKTSAQLLEEYESLRAEQLKHQDKQSKVFAELQQLEAAGQIIDGKVYEAKQALLRTI